MIITVLMGMILPVNQHYKKIYGDRIQGTKEEMKREYGPMFIFDMLGFSQVAAYIKVIYMQKYDLMFSQQPWHDYNIIKMSSMMFESLPAGCLQFGVLIINPKLDFLFVSVLVSILSYCYGVGFVVNIGGAVNRNFKQYAKIENGEKITHLPGSYWGLFGLVTFFDLLMKMLAISIWFHWICDGVLDMILSFITLYILEL
eukprot:UN29949